MIHKSSVMNSKAKISEKVKIGPFCYVGPNVKLNENVELVSNVHIEVTQVLEKALEFFHLQALVLSPKI